MTRVTQDVPRAMADLERAYDSVQSAQCWLLAESGEPDAWANRYWREALKIRDEITRLRIEIERFEIERLRVTS